MEDAYSHKELSEGEEETHKSGRVSVKKLWIEVKLGDSLYTIASRLPGVLMS